MKQREPNMNMRRGGLFGPPVKLLWSDYLPGELIAPETGLSAQAMVIPENEPSLRTAATPETEPPRQAMVIPENEPSLRTAATPETEPPRQAMVIPENEPSLRTAATPETEPPRQACGPSGKEESLPPAQGAAAPLSPAVYVPQGGVPSVEAAAQLMQAYLTYVDDLRMQLDLVSAAMKAAAAKLTTGAGPAELFERELQTALANSRRLKGVEEEIPPGDVSLLEFTDLAQLEALGAYGLRNNVAARRVVLPPDLTRLPQSFFFGCINLIEVVVPKTLEAIGDYAFYGCAKLRRVKLERARALTRIGSYAFAGCESLAELTVPSRVKTIGTGAFRKCAGLAFVRIEHPSRLEEIGSHAFQHCTALRHFAMPKGIKEIRTSLFYGCESLERLRLPARLEEIEDYVIGGCKALTQLVIHGEPNIGEYAFDEAPDCRILFERDGEERE